MSCRIFEGIGEILEKGNSTFEWKIERIASLHGRGLREYKSRSFKFGDTTWNICIANYYASTTGWIYVTVRQEFPYDLTSRKRETVTCRLSLKDKDNRDYMFRIFPKPELSTGKRLYFLWDKVARSEDLFRVMKNTAPDNTMTVSCTLSFNQNDTKEAQDTAITKSVEESKVKADDVRDVLSNPKGVEESKAKVDDVRDVFSNPKGVDRVSHNLEQLLLSEEFSDVTLKVKDREFKAHRQILGSQSTVFHSMFKHDTVERNSGIVDIPDCDPGAFKPFLHYLYSGRLEEMSTSNVLDLYSIADKYDTEDLKSECMTFMMREISVATLCDFIALALLYNESTLLKACTEFFSENTKTIIVTAEWQLFVKENPVAANELFIKAFEKNTN